MKVIDLLNKIANGETPDIKDGTNRYHYSKLENDYITGMGYNYEHFFSHINILNYLNDEVEIIEDISKEDNKIKIKNIPYTFDLNLVACNINDTARERINKAIEYINYCLEENCEDSGDYLDNTHIGEKLISILRGEDNE